MLSFNNTYKEWRLPDFSTIKGIVYFSPVYVEFGYFTKSPDNIPVEYNGELNYIMSKDCCTAPIYWNNSGGYYTFNRNNANNLKTISKHSFFYPIDKCYNFSKLALKARKIGIVPELEYKFIHEFTFGIEYETSAGNIPWLELLENNLVPLYDGSITGHEYVTFPLTYLELPLIRKHLSLLSTYTLYDKNCSLHVHFGGFPIKYEVIDRMCKFWKYFQWDLLNYMPSWSYYVERYKSNGKPYNRPLTVFNLKSFYNNYTGNEYTDDGSFFLPNRYDEEELKKWEVHGRYYNMNIMHLISGNSHKTVEFRFLRPTTNYCEIKWYLLVLGAFLKFSMSSKCIPYKEITVEKVISFVFPQTISDKLISEGKKLYHLHKIQINNGDCPGIDADLKNLYLNVCNFSI